MKRFGFYKRDTGEYFSQVSYKQDWGMPEVLGLEENVELVKIEMDYELNAKNFIAVENNGLWELQPVEVEE